MSPVNSVLTAMHAFQCGTNTVDMCVTNASYLIDQIDKHRTTYRAQAVMALYVVDNVVRVHAHVVLLGNNQVLDPSYEIAQHHPVVYVHAFRDLQSTLLTKFGVTLLPQERQQFVEKFVSFGQMCQAINAGDCLAVPPSLDVASQDVYKSALQYYHAQADFVNSRVQTVNL